MQSDDLFIRKFRRQSPRPTPVFEPKRVEVAEWPPRREGEGAEGESVTTPSRAGLNQRAVARGHIMQRSNSDVTLGDLDSAAKAGAKAARSASEKAGQVGQGESNIVLHREYGSLSSLEKQSRPPEPCNEEQTILSPSALRFKDPFLLLGLQETPPEPDGFFRALECPKPAKPPKPDALNKKSKPSPLQVTPIPCDQTFGGAWVRNFAHYDVQSILFDLCEAATSRDSVGRKKNITSGASAASQLRPLAQPPPASPSQSLGSGTVGTTSTEEPEPCLLDEGDGNDNDLLLSCPHFRNEMGGEERAGLGRTQCCSGRWRSLQSPNDAVSVLEEPRESHVQQQGKSNYFIEHADLGARYYHKYFYMKGEKEDFFIDFTSM